MAQNILAEMIKTGADPEHLLLQNNKNNKEDLDLSKIIAKIMEQYSEQVNDFRNGKEPLIKFFLGLQ